MQYYLTHTHTHTHSPSFIISYIKKFHCRAAQLSNRKLCRYNNQGPRIASITEPLAHCHFRELLMVFNVCLQMKCDTSHPAFHVKVKNVHIKSAELGALNRKTP